MIQSAHSNLPPGKMRSGLWAIIGVCVAAMFLVIRAWDNLDALPAFWAEDATVFLRESSSGPVSLFKAYAGYLHTYPRLIALVASGLPLEFTKVVFLLGWFLSFVTLCLVSYYYLLRLGVSARKAFWIFVLVPLTPAQEVFFNLTNSQWFFGASLFLLYSPPVLQSLSRLSKVRLTIIAAGVLVLGLTGPFSIFVLASRIFLLVISWGREPIRVLDAPLFGTALVQAWLFVQSSRLTSSGGTVFDPLGVIEYLVVMFAGSGSGNAFIFLFILGSLSAWIVFLKRKESLRISPDVPSRQTLFLPSGILLLAASNVYHFDRELLLGIASSGTRFNFILLVLTAVYVFGLTSFSWRVLTPVLILALTAWGVRLDTLPFESDGYLSAVRISSEGSVLFEVNPYWPGHFWALEFGNPERELDLKRATQEESPLPESEQL